MKIKKIEKNIKPITCSTWQSLAHITDMKLFQKFDCVLVDECTISTALVKTEDGYRKIKDIVIGDIIWSFNETTHNYELKPVTKLYKNLSKSDILIEITLEDDRVLKFTPNHKFLTNIGWIKAEDLTIESELIKMKIKSIKTIPNKYENVYNLEVQDNHNYIVEDCVVSNCFSCESSIQLQNIIGNCTNATMKIGVAGTLNDEKINRIQLEGLFGRVNQETTTRKLIDNGTLSKLKIKVIILHYKDEIKRQMYKSSYHDEMGLLQQIEERSNFIVKSAETINKNVLILFKNIKYGELLYNKLLERNTGRNVYYIAGATKAEIREQVRKLTINNEKKQFIFKFGKYTIELFEGENILLSNKLSIKVEDLKPEHDVDDNWILQNKTT